MCECEIGNQLNRVTCRQWSPLLQTTGIKKTQTYTHKNWYKL